MIFDFLENWEKYAAGNPQVWKDAMDFIASVDAATEEKKYLIHGDAFYAFVQNYETGSLETGKIETHQDYIDIHAIITGRELVYYSPVAPLELFKDFRPDSDDLLYLYKPETAAGFEVSRGTFAVFFPWEGHMTRIQTAQGSEQVKKVVLKIASGLLF